MGTNRNSAYKNAEMKIIEQMQEMYNSDYFLLEVERRIQEPKFELKPDPQYQDAELIIKFRRRVTEKPLEEYEEMELGG